MDGQEVKAIERLFETHENSQAEKFKCVEKKIKEMSDKLLDPDNGLFARVHENTAFRERMQEFFDPEDGICSKTRKEVEENARLRRRMGRWLAAIGAALGALLLRAFLPLVEEFVRRLGGIHG